MSKVTRPPVSKNRCNTAGSTGPKARLLGYALSMAALTAACSQTGNPPVKGVANAPLRPGLNRPLFTEDAYGVSTSPRVAGNGPVAKGGGGFKLGSPYKVAGRWYVPREEPGYDRAGIGSWYGDDFHGRKTANGEIFDKDALTAAHPTLPLPSYVHVTNVENGRTILVRVNDRGPYVTDRLIDLIHASARALDYEHRGHTRVRVRYAGRAPLNGDDRRERQYLAEQRWNNGRALPPVAAYRPPQAPIAPPLPFPEGTPGRWSPSNYRAALAGKPTPEPSRPVPNRSTASNVAPAWGDTRYQPTASLAPASPPSVLPPSLLVGSAARGRVVERDDAYRPGQPQLAHAPASGRAYVQIGIYRDRANAERLRRELGALGPVEVAPIAAGGGPEMYRVRLGPMSPADANAAASKVAARGVASGSVVYE